ncbi:hypothetical protein BWQ96_05910 [Gracilariopsis chorda]|uniref:DUF393 domain-containing protein n=1 Tax=Gracilariopsis chorda TaxID=448386 RepID=A0A2V3IQH5_9FLOR|nr:hypothetical protein BWQ96_05910 [Gracilariopsis chorda]|eukprot:PXF44346.1 hypothetical protein BWQ96_05910 [Gracilariopsis chorda]
MHTGAVYRAAFCSPAGVSLTRHGAGLCSKVNALVVRHAVSNRYIRMQSTQRGSNIVTNPSPSPNKLSSSTPKQDSAEIKLLYDSECPLCVKEVNFLRKRSEQRGNSIAFVDIADADYSAAQNGGVSYEQAMGRIHAITREGEVISGIRVFRRTYEAIGLGWVYAVTRLPVAGWLAERLYNLWADWRLPISGRPPLEQIMRLREEKKTCR